MLFFNIVRLKVCLNQLFDNVFRKNLISTYINNYLHFWSSLSSFLSINTTNNSNPRFIEYSPYSKRCLSPTREHVTFKSKISNVKNILPRQAGILFQIKKNCWRYYKGVKINPSQSRKEYVSSLSRNAYLQTFVKVTLTKILLLCYLSFQQLRAWSVSTLFPNLHFSNYLYLIRFKLILETTEIRFLCWFIIIWTIYP